MKAIRFERYGSPDVLRLEEVEKPTPQADEVLIKVQAAAANPLDWHKMRAAPFLVRLSDGLLKPKDGRVGADVAGVVEAVGSNVTEFNVGDAVFGEATGAFAEYVCGKVKNLAAKPVNLSFEQAAAVPVAAHTALQGLRDTGKIQAGQKVLVNGASGGVGTFGVQIARSYGTEVTAVCSTRNFELVRGIGADHVIDYTQTDFTCTGKKYDLILDAIGNRSIADLRRVLTPKGSCAVAGFTTMARMLPIMLFGSRGQQKVSSFLARPNREDLLVINKLLESGDVVPVIDRCYSLAETAEAIRYLETGRARGKVIITLE